MEADDPDFEPADGWDDYVDRYLEDVRPSVYDGIDPEFDLGLKVVPPYVGEASVRADERFAALVSSSESDGSWEASGACGVVVDARTF